MKYKKIKCFDCDGDGEIEAANPICDKPKSQCCGGCESKFTCTTCNGQGDLYTEDQEIIDFMLMIEAYDKMKLGYKKTIKDFQEMIKSVSENGLMEMELLMDNTHKYQLNLISKKLKRIEKHTEILQIQIRNEYI